MGIDRKAMEAIRKSMEAQDRAREAVIKGARDILKSSKKAIFALHEGDIRKAEGLVSSARAMIRKLRRQAEKSISIESVGAFSAALQEHAESECFLAFLQDKSIPTAAGLGISAEDYLLGLSDLTGELSRYAVNSAIRKKPGEVRRARDLAGEIYGFFIGLELRNGELRKKSDSVKWNLKKIEEVIYDLSLKGRMGA